MLFNKLRLVSYETNAVEKVFTFSDNLKQLAVFDDAIFACSDKRAFTFVRDMGQRQLCSVLTGSQVVAVTVDRLYSLRSVIDSKGTQSIKVRSTAQLPPGKPNGSVRQFAASILPKAL